MFDEFEERASPDGKDEKAALLESGLKFRYIVPPPLGGEDENGSYGKVTICIEK
jgi:hypothetical protein